MQLSYYNCVFVKGVNKQLERVDAFHQAMFAIENCLKADAYFEACSQLRLAREIFYGFSDVQRETLLLKEMKQQEIAKTQEVYKILKRHLKGFAFGFQQEARVQDTDIILTKDSSPAANAAASPNNNELNVNFAMERITTFRAEELTEKTFSNSRDFAVFVKEHFLIDINAFTGFQAKLALIAKSIQEPDVCIDNSPSAYFD